MENAMEINIRYWTRDDLSEILGAWLRSCRHAPRSDMRLKSDAEEAMMHWLLSRFKEFSAFGFVAQQDRVFAGFLVGRIDRWESVPPVIEPRKLGIIDAVYVTEEFRRQGIASRLIDRALMAMRECNADAVETIYDFSDAGSAETWRRAGFVPWMVHAYRML